MSHQTLCLYVDNSNIFHEGQRFASLKRGEDRHAFRIHFSNFIDLVTRAEPATEIVWGGSTPPTTDSVWSQLKEQGISPVLIPRSESGENETVDHAIQLQMHRHARKYRKQPGTMVLCTGDGKGYFKEEGFLYDVEGFVEDGWKIRVVSWTHACHQNLLSFAREKGEFVALEDHYDHVTFIKSGRLASASSFAATAGDTAMARAMKAAAAAPKKA